MAICGIAVVRGGEPLGQPRLEAMVGALAIDTGDVRAICATSQGRFGAISGIGTTSLASSDTVAVVCDADLYNLDELQSNISAGLPQSNVAGLIATLYLERGNSFLQSLRGVFSIAIWDERSRTLLLARDRFGVQPLCYAASASEIVFASHPRGILASGRVKKEVNLPAIADFLNYSVVPAPETSFQNVRKLNPGEYLVWKDGELKSAQYWDMQYPEDARGSHEQLARELLGSMEDAVRVTSRDLDPRRSGCFLSGGTDSSSIVGLLAGIEKEQVNTFSVGFSEERFNELEYAHLASRHFKTSHHESILGPDAAYDTISRIVAAYDEPFANASAIPTFWCAELARKKGMDVLLAGDGGDELFGGNERYRKHQIYSFYGKLPRPLRQSIIEPVLYAFPDSSKVLGKVQRHIRWANIPNPERYSQRRMIQEFPLEQVLGPSLPIPNDRLAIVRSYYERAPAKSELNRLLYIDVKMTLGDDDLRKVVRTAELVGLKVRFPFLDHRLAEFSGGLPANLKVRGLDKRYLFKRATRNLLPRAIIKKKKHGFALPIGLWLKTDAQLREMSRDLFSDPKTYQRGYFRKEFIEQLIADFDRDQTPYSIYYGELLFEFLMLELWHRCHVEERKS
jgi:asparagine synthase (glutamine-hydrolysing)